MRLPLQTKITRLPFLIDESFYLHQEKQLRIDELADEIPSLIPDPYRTTIFYVDSDNGRDTVVLVNPVNLEYIFVYAENMVVMAHYNGDWSDFWANGGRNALLIRSPTDGLVYTWNDNYEFTLSDGDCFVVSHNKEPF